MAAAPFHRFGRRATDFTAVPQIWPLSGGLVARQQIWLPGHIFGCCATDLAAVPQVWLLCHRFDCWTKDLAGALDLAGLQNAKEINGKYGALPIFYCCVAGNQNASRALIMHSECLGQAVKFFSYFFKNFFQIPNNQNTKEIFAKCFPPSKK